MAIGYGYATLVQAPDGAVTVHVDDDSVRKECEKIAKDSETEQENIQYPDPIVSVLSVVGPYVSYEVSYVGYCAGANMNASLDWRTISMRTGAEVPLSELFDANDIQRALSADTYLKKKRQAPDFDFGLDVSSETTSYAIHHVSKDRIAVRIKMTASSQSTVRAEAENEIKAPKLGLLLKPKRSETTALAQKAQRARRLLNAR